MGSEMSSHQPVEPSWAEAMKSLASMFEQDFDEDFLASVIPEREPPLAATTASFNWDGSKQFDDGVLMLTKNHIVAIGGPAIAVMRREGCTYHLNKLGWLTTAHAFSNGAQTLQVMSVGDTEWLRMLYSVSPEEQEIWRDGIANLPSDWAVDPGRLPEKVISPDHGSYYLYRDRLVIDLNQHLPFTGPVNAIADTSGNISAVRGRNLADKALGATLFGPVGLLVAGNAKIETVDNRTVYLLIDSDDWVFAREFDPEHRPVLQQFASKINRVAKDYVGNTGDSSADCQGLGLAAEIKELAALHENGTLTADEFAEAKHSLINGAS